MSAPHGIVVIGSANADLVLEIDRRPGPGETVLGSDVVVTPGGKGANQAVAAGRLGGDVAFVGCVGDDGHGALLRRSLTGAGIDVSQLGVVPAPTGTAVILLTPDGENSIVVSPAANRHVTIAYLEERRAAWATAAVLVLQLEVPFDTVRHAAVTARAAGGRVVLNAAPAADLPAEVLRAADPLVVNESEARHLLRDRDEPDPHMLATDLLGLGPASVVLTLGPRGAVHAERDAAPVHTPAPAADAVDTTGAGDAFVGALAVELAEGRTLAAAVRLATDVAAASVQRRGAQASYPERGDVGR